MYLSYLLGGRINSIDDLEIFLDDKKILAHDLYEMSWNLICADVILTCLPVVVLYIACQKYIVGGQTEGAVKG